MGILDDLKMGLGIKEKTRDYYDRTAKTLERNDGADRARQYREYAGIGPGGSAITDTRYGNAPHYSDTNTGPQRPGDNASFSFAGLLDRLMGRDQQPRTKARPKAAAATAGYAAPVVTSSPLTAMSNQMSAGPNITMPDPMANMQMSRYDTMGTFMDPSQTDDNMFGVAGGMPLMPGMDAPIAPQTNFGGAIDAPFAGFATADGAVMADSPEADEDAYQQWLSTEGSNKFIQQWDKTNPGFSRRMYDTAKRIKAGKF